MSRGIAPLMVLALAPLLLFAPFLATFVTVLRASGVDVREAGAWSSVAGVAWLAARGVPTEALRAETRAATSVENLRFTLDLAPDGPSLIVTDDLHALRSELVAARLGIDARSVGVRTASDRLRYALRESAAILAYRLGTFRRSA